MLIQAGAREAVVSALTHYIYFLSLAQVAATFYAHASNPTEAAAQALKRLVRAGVLGQANVNVQILPPPLTPLFLWTGQGDPDYSALATQGQRRFRNVGLSSVRVWYATEMAARQIGGISGKAIFRRPQQLSHEINLNEVFCQIFRGDREVASTFIAERDLTARYLRNFSAGDRLPDGIVFRDGKPHAIEFGGKLRAERARKLHEFCRRQRPPLSYTLY